MKTRFHLYYILVFVFSLAIVIASSANAIIRIMPLGDSITRGSSPGGPDQDYQVAYRKTLWDLLVADGYDVDFVGSQDTGSAVFNDSQHEGHGGYTADLTRNNIYDWLVNNPADIILLHIGTNDLDGPQTPAAIVSEVNQLLNEIDRYDANITVILALIINRLNYSCGNASATTTFNNDLYDMAQDRISSGDRIEIVDMECGAGIDYREQSVGGDMFDSVHPFETGFEKMADVWLSGLQTFLPVGDAGSDQNEYEGNTVTLDASNSFDPNSMILTYFWDQQSGSPVTLSDSMAVTPTFTAPDVGLAGETLTFKLSVTDADGFESTDITNVDVLNDDCPDDPNKTEPGVCGCGIADNDTDLDGTPDCNDNCSSDPNKTEPGVCGCGNSDTDSDGDGTPDCNDNCSSDPNKTEPGVCGCGNSDTDSDGDGTPDCNDNCSSDPNKTEPGVCGCGNSDTDSDGDGTADCNEVSTASNGGGAAAAVLLQQQRMVHLWSLISKCSVIFVIDSSLPIGRVRYW